MEHWVWLLLVQIYLILATDVTELRAAFVDPGILQRSHFDSWKVKPFRTNRLVVMY